MIFVAVGAWFIKCMKQVSSQYRSSKLNGRLAVPYNFRLLWNHSVITVFKTHYPWILGKLYKLSSHS